MEWRGPGIILSVRNFGETSVICNVFTQNYGRYAGLVRGGAGRRQRSTLQIGNQVEAHWRARLSEHLGAFSLELDTPHAAHYLTEPLELSALTTLCGWLLMTPEREAYPRLYETCLAVIKHLDSREIWPALMVRFELAFLVEMGFGLDMSACAATGETTNLKYISPRSGRAVSEAAAQPYLSRLFKLPEFLHSPHAEPSRDDVIDGFTLLGHFIERRVLTPAGQTLPESRSRLISALQRI